MEYFFSILIFLVVVEHFYFLILEMFLWTKPKGIKAFGLKSKAFADETKVLAANQGLYNGFLATGLLMAHLIEDRTFLFFFLICIIIAGIYGAYSTKKIKLLYIQSIPSLIALIMLIFN